MPAASSPPSTSAVYDAAKLTEPAEVVLHEAVQKVGAAPTGLADFVTATEVLVEPITNFFEEILVMAEDPEVRAARLGLLATIRDLAAPVLDWQALGTSLNTQSERQGEEGSQAFGYEAVAVGAWVDVVGVEGLGLFGGEDGAAVDQLEVWVVPGAGA